MTCVQGMQYIEAKVLMEQNRWFRGYTFPAFINCSIISNQGAECKSDCSDLNQLPLWPAGNLCLQIPPSHGGQGIAHL